MLWGLFHCPQQDLRSLFLPHMTAEILHQFPHPLVLRIDDLMSCYLGILVECPPRRFVLSLNRCADNSDFTLIHVQFPSTNIYLSIIARTICTCSKLCNKATIPAK